MVLTLFTVLIEEYTFANAFVQTFYAHAHHLNEALEKINNSALKIGLKNPVCCEVCVNSVFNLPKELRPFKNLDVFWSQKKYYYSDTEIFKLPYGVSIAQ